MALYFKEGNTPIILVSTHGGLRRRGFTITAQKTADKNVNKTLFAIEKALKKRNHRPYIILSKIHRSVVDLNRPPNQAHGREASEIWSIYHANGLRQVDIRANNWQNSSVTPLARRFNIAPRKLIYGRQSLCGKLERKGLRCIPNNHGHTDLRRYLNGGFITRNYSQKYSTQPVAAIQIELPRTLRQHRTISKTGKQVADSILSFVNQSAFKKQNQKKMTKKKKPRRRRGTRRRGTRRRIN